MSAPSSETRVTVFVPTYNRAPLLAGAIRSVLGQSFERLSVVVADNASTDETPDVVAAFGDERLTYVRRPENIGLLGNFKACLSGISTDYCLVLCDDDLLEPEFLERTVPLLDENARVGIAHTSFHVIDAEGALIEGEADWTCGLTADTIESRDRFMLESIKWGCRVCSSAALMRTEALPAEPFEEEDFPAIDFGLWLRMAVDWDVAFVARPLADYRIHRGAQSAAFGPPVDAGYGAGEEWVAKREQLKTRFLDEHGHRLEDAAALRRLLPGSRRRDLLGLVRKATVPERNPAETLRMLRWAAGVDPRVLSEADTWRLLAASLLSPRVFARVQRLRRQST
jgi:hypothetical protein